VTPELFAAHARVEDHHWWFSARRQILRAVVGAVAPAHTGLAVADIGCGTGANLAAMADGYRCLGIDPAPEAIRLAQSRFPALDFRVSDDPRCLTDHLAEGGVILMTDVLEHVEDDRRLLATAVDALPAGGHAVITVPADPSLWSGHDIVFGHYRRYRLEELVALWSGLPVEAVAVTHFNARLLPVIRLIRRWQGTSRRPGGDLAVPVGPLNGALRRLFAGEQQAVLRAIATGRPVYPAGVSLLAVIRRT
jgi:SAM-dependent methyltransferase